MSINQMKQLEASFRAFTETTRHLEEAHEKLTQRIQALDQELERKNRELARKVEEINRMKDYLDSILNGMSDGVVAVDLEGRITTFNRAAGKITGLNADDVLSEEYASVFGQRFDHRSGSSIVDHQVTEIVGKEGKPIPISERVSRVTDSVGLTVGTVKVFQDLREITQLRQEIRRKDRLAALGEMAATVAHEIRNPLGGIEGFALLLARDFRDSAPQKKLIERILEGTKSLNQVVSDLLAFTRPLEFKFDEIECAGLIDDVLLLLDGEIQSRGVSVERGYGNGNLIITADREKMRQVLLNILLNAVQSMADGGALTIETSRVDLPPDEKTPLVGKAARIRVVDSGCGIDPADQEKIFNPFFTTKDRGTGLGLAIAAKITEGHHGRIEVQSELNAGSTLDILLPIREEQ